MREKQYPWLDKEDNTESSAQPDQYQESRSTHTAAATEKSTKQDINSKVPAESQLQTTGMSIFLTDVCTNGHPFKVYIRRTCTSARNTPVNSTGCLGQSVGLT